MKVPEVKLAHCSSNMVDKDILPNLFLCRPYALCDKCYAEEVCRKHDTDILIWWITGEINNGDDINEQF